MGMHEPDGGARGSAQLKRAQAPLAESAPCLHGVRWRGFKCVPAARVALSDGVLARETDLVPTAVACDAPAHSRVAIDMIVLGAAITVFQAL